MKKAAIGGFAFLALFFGLAAVYGLVCFIEWITP